MEHTHNIQSKLNRPSLKQRVVVCFCWSGCCCCRRCRCCCCCYCHHRFRAHTWFNVFCRSKMWREKKTISTDSLFQWSTLWLIVHLLCVLFRRETGLANERQKLEEKKLHPTYIFCFRHQTHTHTWASAYGCHRRSASARCVLTTQHILSRRFVSYRFVRLAEADAGFAYTIRLCHWASTLQNNNWLCASSPLVVIVTVRLQSVRTHSYADIPSQSSFNPYRSNSLYKSRKFSSKQKLKIYSLNTDTVWCSINYVRLGTN